MIESLIYPPFLSTNKILCVGIINTRYEIILDHAFREKSANKNQASFSK